MAFIGMVARCVIVNSLGHVRGRGTYRILSVSCGRCTVSKDRLPFVPRTYLFRGERNGVVVLENVKKAKAECKR